MPTLAVMRESDVDGWKNVHRGSIRPMPHVTTLNGFVPTKTQNQFKNLNLGDNSINMTTV